MPKISKADQARADAALPDEEFREVVRTWIAENYMLERNPPNRPPFAYCRPWYTKLNDRGWLAPNWPIELGGSDLSILKQVILVEEQERFGCARINDIGVVMVGPLLIRFGTDAQRARLLPGILAGDIVWCQGYSEPNAGSDLASLRSTAVRDGDAWVINGEKIWTTRASDANWMFALLRTEKTARKQEGISFFIFPMDTPGITVRPILDLSGGTELHQTLFQNGRVPLDSLVGKVNEGWAISNALLGLERIYVGLPKHSAYALGRLHELMTYTNAWSDLALVDRFTQLQLDLDDHVALFESAIDRLNRTGTFPPDVSLLKLSQTELYQRITDMMLAVGGELSGAFEPLAENNLFPAGQFLLARPTTIFGGSSEIQRNILATRVLGLPR